MKEVIKIINTISPQDTVVIGCSGGEDSMCLLNLLINNINKDNIIVAHVNHNIRINSIKEYEFVKNYCNENKIVFEGITLPNDRIYNESELRKMRYNFFEEIILKYKASFLITAHHGDDLIETILMRITRGSNLKGYAGIEVLSEKNKYKILRPLLYIDKKTISEYNKRNNIPHVIDESNELDKYTRNRYRHYILPILKKENNKVHNKYLTFSKELLAYYEYVDKIVKEDIEKNGFPLYNLHDFDKKDNLIQRKIIEKYLYYYYGNDIDKVNSKHIDSILTIISKSGNKEICLPLNTKIIKEYETLQIVKKKDQQNIINEEFHNYYKNDYFTLEVVQNSDEKSNYIIRLLSSEIEMPLHIRSIQNGDKIKVKNLNGHKKVKDILIDSKISLTKRMNQIVLTDNKNTIIWIPGIKKSEFDKSKDEKCDIIIKYEER